MNSDRPLRIGTLGAATITNMALLQPAQGRRDVVVAAIAARDPERARAYAEKHRIAQVHADYQQLIQDSELDAVYVPLPMSEHARWSIAALEAGKHVLCEKPIACNAREAESMAEAAERSGKVLFEAMHWRYHPIAERLLELTGPGGLSEIGEIVHMEALFTAAIQEGDIRLNWSLGGGAVMDFGAYPISWMRALAGCEPTVVHALALEDPPKIDRAITVDLHFTTPSDKTITGRFKLSMQESNEFIVKLDIEGTRGRIEVDNLILPHLYHRLCIIDENGDAREESWPSSANTKDEKVLTTYDYQLEAFVRAIREGKTFPTTSRDAAIQMAVVDACYGAAGLPIRGI